MKIADIIANQGRIDIEGIISEISPPKEFSKFGRTGKITTLMLEDTSGKISLALWDEEANYLNKGDKIKIINAYCKEWRGEKQINLGRYGMIEKV